MEEVSFWNAISKLPERLPNGNSRKKETLSEFSKREDAEELRLLASIPVAQFTHLRPANIVIISLPMAPFETFLRAPSPDQDSLDQVKELADRKSFPLVLGIP